MYLLFVNHNYKEDNSYAMLRINKIKGTIKLDKKRFISVILLWLIITIAFLSVELLINEYGQLENLLLFFERMVAIFGTSISNLIQIGPFTFAISAGIMAVFNPCGFALLLAYLGMIGNFSTENTSSSISKKLGLTIIAGTTVSLGFTLIFILIATLINIGIKNIITLFPIIGFIIGILLIGLGLWIIYGGSIYSSIPTKIATLIPHSNKKQVRAFFLFGIAYGLASLSCTLPIFLAVLATSSISTSLGNSLLKILGYSFGMSGTIILISIAISIFPSTLGSKLSFLKTKFYVISGIFTLIAGIYVTFYWMISTKIF